MAVRVHRPRPRITWVRLSLVVGAVLTVAWSQWAGRGLDARVVSDTVLFVVIPGALALAFGRDLGFRVDRRAIRNTLLLAALVLPFYLVGSTLPSVRSYYPMWGLASTAPDAFVPHAIKQLAVVVAAEVYYRGLLCVGVRELGWKSILLSPVVYAAAHATKPPVELLLSGPTDVLFGAADYQSTSLLPSIVAHGLGLVLLDWLVLHHPLFPPEQVLAWLSWLPVTL